MTGSGQEIEPFGRGLVAPRCIVSGGVGYTIDLVETGDGVPDVRRVVKRLLALLRKGERGVFEVVARGGWSSHLDVDRSAFP